MSPDPPLLEVSGLTVHYTVRAGRRGLQLRAVSDVSLRIGAGETLGLVGESGCGKSTLGLAVQGLVPMSAGTVRLAGEDLGTAPGRLKQRLRRNVQLVFQDPTASLNSRMTVENLLLEPMEVHKLYDDAGRRARVRWLLDAVSLPRNAAGRYPHEMSGGQRQRVALARALSVEPRLIICDEPVTALDVSVRAQILNLLLDLQDELGISYLFISHDLAAIWYLAHNVLVMYLGRPVEQAPRDRLFAAPAHPYTRVLIDAVPVLDAADPLGAADLAEGEVPSPLNPPSGCVFRTRCPLARDRCREQVPQWRDIGGAGSPHWVACHYA
ncbi:MAG: ABC transporter ATP-binding protein [Streptosporangiaceae bacterium]